MLNSSKYEQLADDYWLSLQIKDGGLFLTVLSFVLEYSKYTALIACTKESYPALMAFETPEEVLNLIKIGRAYHFDVKSQNFYIKWQLCSNLYTKDFSVQVKTKQEPLSALDELRIENALLKKRLSQYESQRLNAPKLSNSPCKIKQNAQKIGISLTSEAGTQPEPSQPSQQKRGCLIQYISSAESDEQEQKQIMKSKNLVVQKHQERKKMIRKEKVKLEEPTEIKKRGGRKKKNTIETCSSEKSPAQTQSNTVKINFQNGDYYYGEIKNNLYHGHGIYFSLINGTFEGKWEYGKANGEGISKDPLGNQHSGFYINDKRNGKGLDIYINGERYEGNFENDAKSGQGKYIYENGDCYEGEWKNDMYHGYGVEKYCDGTIYEGNWLNDEKDGESIFTDKEGKKWKQKWERGTKIYQELIG